MGLVATDSFAQQTMDPALTRIRSWTLSDAEHPASPVPAPAYRMRLEMAMVSGSRWTPESILDAANQAAAILLQCGIAVTRAELHEFAGPPRYRQLSTPDSREFAQRAGLGKPSIFFVDDTRQRPAYDAEAIGRGNARMRPEMMDTVWITAATRDLPIAFAHELVHVLTDSGEHSDVPGNLMREDTAPGNTQLTPAQCRTIVTTGQANGLLGHAPPDDGRPRP